MVCTLLVYFIQKSCTLQKLLSFVLLHFIRKNFTLTSPSSSPLRRSPFRSPNVSAYASLKKCSSLFCLLSRVSAWANRKSLGACSVTKCFLCEFKNASNLLMNFRLSPTESNSSTRSWSFGTLIKTNGRFFLLPSTCTQ